MKKLINDPADVVADALRGIQAAHGDRVRVDHRASDRLPPDAPRPGKVGLVSGGGSGHEPMHGGFVGLGMLDAACAGEVFTSPVPDQMVEATKAGRRRGRGAAHREELHRRRDELRDGRRDGGPGLRAPRSARSSPMTTSRCTDSLYTAGRRGVGVTVLLEKIVGAAAEQGRSLAEVADLAARVNDSGPQHGHGPDLVHRSGRRQADLRPRRGRDGDRHRHPWRARALPGAARAGRRTSPPCWSTRCSATFRTRPGDAVIAFVNGMGGTPLIELYVMYAEVARDPGAGGHHGRPVAGRQLHHLAGDGRLLGHPAQGRRRAASVCGTRRSTPRACAGASERWPALDVDDVGGVDPRLCRADPRRGGPAHRARRGDRGRRPRQQPGPRDSRRGGQDRRRVVRQRRARCSRPSA